MRIKDAPRYSQGDPLPALAKYEAPERTRLSAEERMRRYHDHFDELTDEIIETAQSLGEPQADVMWKIVQAAQDIWVMWLHVEDELKDGALTATEAKPAAGGGA